MNIKSKEPTIDSLVANKYLALQNSANSRDIEFTLTLSDVRSLLTSKKCFYSGVLLTDKTDSENQRTIDRVDNNKGYVKNNVVACAKSLNLLKGSLSVENIIMLYKGLKKKKLI